MEGEQIWIRSCHSANCCVEVSVGDTEVMVRDSKNPNDPFLRFSRDEWRDFLAGAKNGEFDQP